MYYKFIYWHVHSEQIWGLAVPKDRGIEAAKTELNEAIESKNIPGEWFWEMFETVEFGSLVK